MFMRFFTALIFCFLCSCSINDLSFFDHESHDNSSTDSLPINNLSIDMKSVEKANDQPKRNDFTGSALSKSSSDKDNATSDQSKHLENDWQKNSLSKSQLPEITTEISGYNFSSAQFVNPSESEILAMYSLRNSSEQVRPDLITVNKNGDVLFYEAEASYEIAKQVSKIKEGFTSVAFSRSNMLLATAYIDGENIYDIATNKKIHTINRINSRVGYMDFAPDGQSLLIAGVDSVIYRWQFELEEKAQTIIETEKSLERYIGHSSVVNQVRFHPFGRVFVSTDWGGVVIAWMLFDKDRYEGQYDENIFLGRSFSEEVNRIRGSRSSISIVEQTEFSEDGQYFFSADEAGIIEVWSMRGFKQVLTAQTHKGKIFDFCYDSDTNTLVSIGRDGKLKVWKVTSKNTKVPGVKEYALEIQQETTLNEAGMEKARKLIFADHDNVLVGSSDGTIKLFRIKI